MAEIKELFQSADWKTEKHVPLIEAPEKIGRGETLTVKVTVGKEIPHPNKTEHHIRWIELYFHPEGGKYPYQIGRAEFTTHGESVQGPDTSTVYSQPEASFSLKTDQPGTLLAASFCNIHGLWQSSRKLALG